MSFVSGRKLGFFGSLIQVVLPIIAVMVVVIYVLSVIGNYVPSMGSTPSVPDFSSLFAGLIIPIIIPIGIVTFIGFVLFIIAMHRLSQYYTERGIFNNALIGFIISLVGPVIGLTALALEYNSLISTLQNLSQTGSGTMNPLFPTQLGQALTAAYYVGLVFGILTAIFYMLAFNKLADASGNGTFRTAGILYLIGAVLTIAVIGGLLVWIAWILAAVAFNSLKPKQPPI